MELIAKGSLQITKPVEEVFEAVANPIHLTQYFVSYSSGRLETGAELSWEFGDFPGKFPVHVIEVLPRQSISFVWDAETKVSITFREQEDGSTVVYVSEGAKELSSDNLVWLRDNTFGWSNFLHCLKAYLEYGINLRKGAFDYRNSSK